MYKLKFCDFARFVLFYFFIKMKDFAIKIKKELDKYKAIPSTIEIEGETPLLKIGKPENWNFLLEGKDFEMKLDGKITWII